MPKLQEICRVVAGGQRYETWETVDVTHACDPFSDHAMLTVSEPSTGATSLTALKLKPGDKAQVYLAGQLVLDGEVYLRQAAYDAAAHAVQIGISSMTQNVHPATVQSNPGQYMNSTLQQICSSVCATVGVQFSIDGAPPGVEIPFPRVNEHLGESVFTFLERLCRQRNIHMIDDGKGGILGYRGPKAPTGLVLKEGGNILRARLLLRNDDEISAAQGRAQNHNQDEADGNSQPKAESSAPEATVSRTRKFAAEEPHSSETLQHRTDHEIDDNAYRTVDGDVTVQGWLCPDNTLWFAHLRERVTLDSPMLNPSGSPQYAIKGITHRQSTSEGTTTLIQICNPAGLGSGSAQGTPGLTASE